MGPPTTTREVFYHLHIKKEGYLKLTIKIVLDNPIYSSYSL